MKDCDCGMKKGLAMGKPGAKAVASGKRSEVGQFKCGGPVTKIKSKGKVKTYAGGKKVG